MRLLRALNLKTQYPVIPRNIYNPRCELITWMNPTKACGPDRLPSRILKECAAELALSISKLFNKSLSRGKLPKQWEEALSVPIHKKKDRDLVTNYRPISLLCVLSKVLERCVFNRCIDHLSDSLSNSQHGFLKGRSTTTKMLSQDRPSTGQLN